MFAWRKSSQRISKTCVHIDRRRSIQHSGSHQNGGKKYEILPSSLHWDREWSIDGFDWRMFQGWKRKEHYDIGQLESLKQNNRVTLVHSNSSDNEVRPKNTRRPKYTKYSAKPQIDPIHFERRRHQLLCYIRQNSKQGHQFHILIWGFSVEVAIQIRDTSGLWERRKIVIRRQNVPLKSAKILVDFIKKWIESLGLHVLCESGWLQTIGDKIFNKKSNSFGIHSISMCRKIIGRWPIPIV